MERIPLSAEPNGIQSGASLSNCARPREDMGTNDPDMAALRNENSRLRELVVQLSALVIKNILNRK